MYRAVLIAIGLLLPALGRADDLPAKQLPKLGLPDAIKAWSKDVRSRRDAVNLADRRAWQAIQTKEDWEKFKAPRIEALRKSLGEWPSALEHPALVITNTIKGDGFQIANMIYETRLGFFVTANLYSPAEPATKMPGILICTSHHNPKTQGELEDMGMTWARLGCLVLVPDQLGHGERRNHPFASGGAYPGPFKVGRQDYYFRYNEALQLHLIGDSLMGWMVWDLMRDVDLLVSRPGVDRRAIILLGSVAGGGDPAAVTAALDPRISAVVPFNFGGPQPETKFPLPADAEASFNYLGGGSWESTRNLRLSGQDGFLPWVIVGSVAPRGLIYGHEFAWDRERDPVWARLQKIYGFYHAGAHLSSIHGRGAVTGKPPQSTHCNNIGPEHRLQMYPTLRKWFGIAEPDREYQQRLPAEDLACWTEEAKKTYQPRSLWQMTLEIGKQRVDGVRARRAELAPKQAAGLLREDWARLLGRVEPSKRPAAYEVTKFSSVEVGSRRDGLGAYVLIVPPHLNRGQKPPVIVAFAQAGIEALGKERGAYYQAILDKGIAVCLVQLRGMGPKIDRGRTSTSTALSAMELMLGETVMGHQLRELRELLGHLRSHGGVDGQRIALWGDSLAKVNPPSRLLEVPLDAADMPDIAEPGCCLLAMLGGLFEDVLAVYGSGGLVSYESVLRRPFVYVPHDAIVPEALKSGDWTDLAAALAPRPLRLERMVDAVNRPVAAEELARAYDVARQTFRKAAAADRFSLGAEPSSAESAARWFAVALKN